MKEEKLIYCIGDVHGSWHTIEGYLNYYMLSNDILIQVGDFGIGFRDFERDLQALSPLNDLLKEKNCHLYIIRGNHDDPEAFDGNGDYDLSNITFLPDYSILELEGRKFLFVGGAISIDRCVRVPEKSYWKKEGFVFDEEKIKNISGVDVVITHSAPDFATPVGFNGLVEHWIAEDDHRNSKKSLRQELILEREQIKKMYEILKEKNNIKSWIYGHFHFSNRKIHDATDFILLDIGEMAEI